MSKLVRLWPGLLVVGLLMVPVSVLADDAPDAADGSVEHAAYVGDDTCTTCHENQHPNFSKTVHSRVMGPEGTLGGTFPHTCESCHGPGSEHVAGGGGEAGNMITFGAGSREEIERANETCLGCHRMGQQLHWNGSTHDSRGLACTTCHNPVDAVSRSGQLAHANSVEVCTSCHLQQKAKIYKNNHMPLRPTADGRSGWMDCTSCHNPHGSPTEHMLVRASTTETCYTCHADKRGPFLWEHAPVTEDCANCHDPHGSTRQAMLKLSLPRLCQTCHLATLHPSEARLPTNKFVIGQSCLGCHSRIHGSNHPSGFVFTR